MSFLDFDEHALRQRQGEKWHHYPEDVLAAWVADMDYVVAPPIRDAITARVAAADFGYPLSPRKTGLPEMFVERVRARFDWAIKPRDVAILSDVVQGLYIALETFCEHGDGAVIQTPIYPPFLRAAKETGRQAVCCPLVPGDSRYEIDFDALEASIGENTRLFMLCNPHNPSGRAFTHAELVRIAELACRHELVIVSDEIHADLVLDDRRHLPIASIDQAVGERTITLMSASKAFNIAGMRMAFAHFGSDALRKRFSQVHPHMRGGTNTLSIAAVRAAWTDGQPWLDDVLAQLRRNRDRVAAFVAAQLPHARHYPPEATYLAWLDMSAYRLKPDPQTFFLEQARVALNDGRTFGAEGEGHVRLNFATSEELLERILERLAEALPAG